MGILNPKEETVTTPVFVEPRAIAAEVRSSIVDSRYNPLSSLLTHVEGASWIVNYYSQVLDADDELSDLQNTLDPVYQQYRLIKHLEMRVNDELSQAQNDQTMVFDIVGAATLYPGIKPNTGDIFLADIGDGRLGVFTVTRTEKKTIFKDACYQINYVMRSYLDDVQRADLNSKVVKSTTFVKDQIYFGNNPVVVDSELDQITKLRKGYNNLIAHYFSDFYNIEHCTMLLPNQINKTYDPFMTSALLATVDQLYDLSLMKIRVLNVDRDPQFKRHSLWSCFMSSSYDLLPMCFFTAGVMPVVNFAEKAEFNGVYYSGVEEVIYPLDLTTLVKSDGTNGVYFNTQAGVYVDPFVPGRISPGVNRYVDPSRLITNTQLGIDDPVGVPGIETNPDIHLVTLDDYYVFSEAFYTDADTGKSKLEQIALESLKGNPINKAILLDLSLKARSWGNLERFYYIPILLILTQMALRDY